MRLSTDARRARRNSYVPLMITARLRCGIISDGLLPIDSVLYFAQHRQARPGEQVITRSREHAIVSDGPLDVLPLKRLRGDQPDWYYAASCAQWPTVVADGVDHWTKRIDSRYIDLLEPQTAKLSTSGGRYRGYRMPVAYRHALALTWYVVGEPARIRSLLALMTHLGKKTAMGWGAVIEWTVEPHGEDWSVIGPTGLLMRPVPDAMGLLYGFRPPYWLPRHQAPCRLPTLP